MLHFSRPSAGFFVFAFLLTPYFWCTFIIVGSAPWPTTQTKQKERTMMTTTKMDPRIGVLNSGKFYAYANGYDAEPVMGTLAEVEAALGLRAAAAPVKAKPAREFKVYSVRLTFEFPAWDEVDGYVYAGIPATSKREAIKAARRLAENDGHAVSGRGRYYFTATEQADE